MGNYNNQKYNSGNSAQSTTKYSQAYRYGYGEDEDNLGSAPIIKPSGTKISFGDDDGTNYNEPVNYDNNYYDSNNNNNYDNDDYNNNGYDNYNKYKSNNNDYPSTNYKDNKKDFKSKKESFNNKDNNNGDFNRYNNNSNQQQQQPNSKYSTAYRYGFGDDDGPAPEIKPSGKKVTFGSDDEDVDESEILPEVKEDEKLNFNQVENKKKALDTRDRKGKRAKLTHDEIEEEPELEEEDDSSKPTLLAYDPLHDQKEEEEDLKKVKDKDLGLPDWLANPTLISPQDYESIENFKNLIGEELTKKCLKLGYSELFPVQLAILPKLCKRQSTLLPSGDICVSAPTGSGKTLAYSLPLIWSLKIRKIIRLRALIILPTRELVKQTVTLLRQLGQGTDLKILGITGQEDLASEQKLLVKDWNSEIIGDASLIDILVTTPGRLVTHLKSTPNFSLEHLEYLIIDEADRLLNQSYFDWLANVLTNLNKQNNPLKLDPHQLFLQNSKQTKKLLFSATLTRNPSKINQLKLFNPEYFKVASSSGERYPTPAKLKEFLVTCQKSDKPISLLASLLNFKVKKALCFTKSVESGTQLLQLLTHIQSKLNLEGFTQLKIANYSSELTPKKRSEILQKFQKSEINLLICSDLASRGLDLGSELDFVINYDTPTYIKNYIHRIGRTARGGKNGSAITLVELGQKKNFKQIMDKSNRWEMIEEIKLNKDSLKELKKGYENILNELDISESESEIEPETENTNEVAEEPLFKANTNEVKIQKGTFNWLEFTKVNLKI